MFAQSIINWLITGMLHSLFAIGFALVYNTTRIFHIAAAGIYVFAAYMFWWLSARIGIPLFVAALFAMGLSLLSEAGIYRPLRKKTPSIIKTVNDWCLICDSTSNTRRNTTIKNNSDGTI